MQQLKPNSQIVNCACIYSLSRLQLEPLSLPWYTVRPNTFLLLVICTVYSNLTSKHILIIFIKFLIKVCERCVESTVLYYKDLTNFLLYVISRHLKEQINFYKQTTVFHYISHTFFLDRFFHFIIFIMTKFSLYYFQVVTREFIIIKFFLTTIFFFFFFIFCKLKNILYSQKLFQQMFLKE